MEKKVCLYHFLDHEENPFYVGVTNNFKRRKNEHKLYVKKQKKWAVYNKINKLIREYDYELRMEIIKEDLSKEEAYELEMKTIKDYRDKGYKLYNMSEGGEGIVGHKPVFTEEWKKRLSDAAKERVKRDGVNFKGCKHSEDTKRIMKEKHSDVSGDKNPFHGKRHTEQVKEASRERAIKLFRGKEKSEEHKRKIGEAHRGRKYSEEQNKKNSELRKQEAILKAGIYKITTPEGEVIIIKNTYKGICEFLKEKHSVEVLPQSLSNVINGKTPCLKFYPLWRFETIYSPR